MSDVALRKAQRAGSGLLDEVRLLAERVRTGGLSYARVEWAARLGHEAALAVVGKLHPERVIDWASWWDCEHAIRSVCELLHEHWRRPLVAFAVDCAERVLPIYEARESNKAPRKALEAARVWVVDPSPEKEAAARAAEAAAEAEAEAAEREWQKARLAAYALGEVAWET